MRTLVPTFTRVHARAADHAAGAAIGAIPIEPGEVVLGAEFDPITDEKLNRVPDAHGHIDIGIVFGGRAAGSGNGDALRIGMLGIIVDMRGADHGHVRNQIGIRAERRGHRGIVGRRGGRRIARREPISPCVGLGVIGVIAFGRHMQGAAAYEIGPCLTAEVRICRAIRIGLGNGGSAR
jgi:hypothetical protein